ncbi:ankyrin repeat domain-containing protein [Archangium sp.]|uniref:ankyrin repeat domain-containing protein n=1 Tax=Archangium sp. TaxID=1872627 RepID=UPI002D7520B7|nr:ankyrin repeat domain-containing protein [Archangium sp.]HYO56430.1 ankyrin repeat domain-containing protein [Archangium sp.]
MSKELFEAIEKHELERLTTLLAGGADPNELKAGWPNWLPVHAAVEELEYGGPVEALVLLLRHGARVDGLGSDRTATALLMAIFRRQPEAVRMLLAVGADPNFRGSEGDSPLRACVEVGDHAMAAMLLRCGATRTLDEAGGLNTMTALGLAASRLDVPMLELLLQAGAEPEALDADSRTARECLPPREPYNQEAWDAAAALLASRSRA